jgi:hypothetical protein
MSETNGRVHRLASGARLTPWIRDAEEAAEWSRNATTSYLVAMLGVACQPRSYSTNDPREWELSRPHRDAIIAEIDKRFP